MTNLFQINGDFNKAIRLGRTIIFAGAFFVVGVVHSAIPLPVFIEHGNLIRSATVANSFVEPLDPEWTSAMLVISENYAFVVAFYDKSEACWIEVRHSENFDFASLSDDRLESVEVSSSKRRVDSGIVERFTAIAYQVADFRSNEDLGQRKMRPFFTGGPTTVVAIKGYLGRHLHYFTLDDFREDSNEMELIVIAKSLAADLIKGKAEEEKSMEANANGGKNQ